MRLLTLSQVSWEAIVCCIDALVLCSVAVALDFLNIYQRMIPPIQKKTSMLAHYLLELALQEYQFLKYLPSVVATCCLSMAMYTVDGFPMVRLSKRCD